MSTRTFPHPIVLEQMRAPAPSHSCTIRLLFRAGLAAESPDSWPHSLGRICHFQGPSSRPSIKWPFLPCRASCFVGSIVILSARYPRAIWIPSAAVRTKCEPLCMPLVANTFLYHLSTWNSTTHLLETLSKLQNPSEAPGESWLLRIPRSGVVLVAGPSLTGVALGVHSIPDGSRFGGKWIFSGFVANAILRSCRHDGCPPRHAGVLVALTHVVQFGFGPHLVPLFFAGLTCTGIRFVSGNLRWAIFSHLLVNIVIYGAQVRRLPICTSSYLDAAVQSRGCRRG